MWHQSCPKNPYGILQAGTGLYGLQKPGKRQTATHDVNVNLGTLTARAAFSHVPFWQSVAGMVGRIVQRETPGNPVAQPSRAAEYKEVGLMYLVTACSLSSCNSQLLGNSSALKHLD